MTSDDELARDLAVAAGERLLAICSALARYLSRTASLVALMSASFTSMSVDESHPRDTHRHMSMNIRLAPRYRQCLGSMGCA